MDVGADEQRVAVPVRHDGLCPPTPTVRGSPANGPRLISVARPAMKISVFFGFLLDFEIGLGGGGLLLLIARRRLSLLRDSGNAANRPGKQNIHAAGHGNGLGKLSPTRRVVSPACEATSNCLMTSSTAARCSWEFAVTMSELEYGSLVMRTLP